MLEPELTTILLVALNGVYEGAATAETFNGEGKTDILIRADDRNVFIAECLIWDGEEHLRGKMNNQLFKYSMWRDTKVALIVFNRRKNFTETVRKMIETVNNHPQCVRQLPFTHETRARFVFRRLDDPQREFILTCLAFDLPVAE
jgi:hypothetical protein